MPQAKKTAVQPNMFQVAARSTLKRPPVLIAVLLTLLVGTAYLVTRASGSFFSFEPENGSLSAANASVGNDANASGGSYVQLGSAGSPPPPPPTPTVGTMCGNPGTPPAQYDHVIWFNFENYSYDEVQKDARLSYVHSLESQCSLATNFYSERDPSLPNYLAEISGDTQVANDANPPNPGNIQADNIFNLVKQSGREWRTYAESMPSNCYHSNYPATNQLYTAHHEAATYFANIATDCQKWMVPQGTITSGALISDIKNGTLPAIAVVGPNDDGGCSSCGGDVDPQKAGGYLQQWIPAITNSATYKAGKTAIFLTWDEDDSFHGANEPVCTGTPPCQNHVATIVIAPTIHAGSTSSTFFTHYSMLRSTEEMLGLTKLLGHAATANDMRGAFNF